MEITKSILSYILVEPDFVSRIDFAEAEKKAQESSQSILDVIIDGGLIKDEQFGQLYAYYIGSPFANLRETKFSEKAFLSVPDLVARSRRLVVFCEDEKEIKIGMNDPSDLEMIHVLEKKFRKKSKVYFVTERDLDEALLRYKPGLKEELDEMLKRFDDGRADLLERDGLASKIVDLFLGYAYVSKASDVHIEPGLNEVVIRFRIDGVMHRVSALPSKLFSLILSRIKILAKMRTDEHLSAQDGKLRFQFQGSGIDARVSIVPVNEGENIVIRILAANNREVNLDESGLSPDNLRLVREALKNPHGMILVTGPTGCGKTTTIYEIMKIVNTSKVSIATIEDPVEYDIEGISQIQVNVKAGLTFATGLRAIVRQDPDIIVVGEIRDQETAKIAVNSAMTGHLVLSTVHANDAATTLPRLLDMDIEPYLAVSTVRIIIAQRLVRQICEKCRYSYKINEKEIEMINKDLMLEKIITEKHKKEIQKLYMYKGAGCKVCSDSGYKGRIGIFEILEMKDEIKEKVLSRCSSAEIVETAKSLGMVTMFEDGIEKAINGITTLDEVFRVIGEE